MNRRLLLIALFSALSISLGFLLSTVPNIELMSFTVFLSGLFVGATGGVMVGVLSISIYSVFNPFGAPMPQLLAAQIAGFAFIGLCGAVLSPLLKDGTRGSSIIISALAGLVVTLVYDLLTTIATTFIVSGTKDFLNALKGVLITGSFFVLLHALSNTAIFAFSTRPILEAKKAWERGRTK